MKNPIKFSLLILILGFFSSQTAIAADEVEVILEKQITSITPIFMEGHAGDLEKIEGYTFAGDIFMAATNVGTVTGEVTLSNPPADLVSPYDYGMLKSFNVLTGIGSFEVTAQLLLVGSSTTVTQGDSVLAWAGSISNGTGNLQNLYGAVSGTGLANSFVGQGTVKEIYRVRFGF